MTRVYGYIGLAVIVVLILGGLMAMISAIEHLRVVLFVVGCVIAMVGGILLSAVQKMLK